MWAYIAATKKEKPKWGRPPVTCWKCGEDFTEGGKAALEEHRKKTHPELYDFTNIEVRDRSQYLADNAKKVRMGETVNVVGGEEVNVSTVVILENGKRFWCEQCGKDEFERVFDDHFECVGCHSRYRFEKAG